MERGYSFAIVSYASLEELQPLLASAKHYAYILHDKDKTDNHYHIYATFHTQKSTKGVCSLVNSEQNTFASLLLGTKENLLAYFIHADLEDKTQYSSECIVYDDDKKYWSRSEDIEQKTRENESFIKDLFTLNRRQLGIKYGRDYIKNFRAYSDYKLAVIEETEDLRQLEKASAGLIASTDEVGNPERFHAELTQYEFDLITKLRFENQIATRKDLL